MRILICYISLALFGCNLNNSDRIDDLANKNKYAYPKEVIIQGLEKEFDNAAWMYFGGTNIYHYQCDFKNDSFSAYSIVENDPVLVNLNKFNDTIVITIGENYIKDSIHFCGPDFKNKFTPFISFWFKKGDPNVIYRCQGLPINYRKIINETKKEFLFLQSDSLNGINLKEKRALGIYSLDDQERRLIDTVKVNNHKLSPWFLKESIKRKISK